MRIFIVEASTRRYDDNLVVTFFSLSWLSFHSPPTSPPVRAKKHAGEAARRHR